MTPADRAPATPAPQPDVERIVTAALAEVGERPCRIEAQTYLTEMYGKFGFVRDGDDYLEDGIPHVSMLRAGSR